MVASELPLRRYRCWSPDAVQSRAIAQSRRHARDDRLDDLRVGLHGNGQARLRLYEWREAETAANSRPRSFERPASTSSTTLCRWHLEVTHARSITCSSSPGPKHGAKIASK